MRLFVGALCSPAGGGGGGETSSLPFVMSNCGVVTFQLAQVFLVRCGA